MSPPQGKSPHESSPDNPVPLESILHTEELLRRPARQPDFEGENRAILNLTQTLADAPETILQALVDTILQCLHAGSAGISLLTSDGTRFHWPAISGAWKPFIGGGTPRDFGPCGDVLDADAPLLFSDLGRRYPQFQSVSPPAIEALLVPFHVQGRIVGMIWAVSHDDQRKFDAEDLRQLNSLASFTSSAFQSIRYLNASTEKGDALRQSLTDVSDAQRRLREVNEALLVGSLKQHELRLASENLNILLRAEIDHRAKVEEELRELNTTLEERILERTFEAERRTSQLQALAVQLTQAENRERRRLAQMLHDHLQQLLVGAKMRLSFLNTDAPQKSDRKTLIVVREALDEAIEASRTLTVELSPPVLFGAGLAAALQWLGRSMFEKHDLKVEVEADSDAELHNQDLEAFLFQAARELLFNIVKHAKIKQAKIELHNHDGELVELIVQDKGCGFDPQGNTGLTGRAGTGHPVMGFGLMSIRERLDVLGGRMRIDSSVGKGTRISLRLPVHRPETDTSAPADTTVPIASIRRPNVGKIRVLIVDDHALVRQELVRLFAKRPDMEVVGEAMDGKSALEQATRLQPDVVLMDVNMPEMGGIAATRLMVAQNPFVRIIGLSMHTAPEVAAEMRRAGAVEFLSKDGPTESLIAAIQRNTGMGPLAG